MPLGGPEARGPRAPVPAWRCQSAWLLGAVSPGTMRPGVPEGTGQGVPLARGQWGTWGGEAPPVSLGAPASPWGEAARGSLGLGVGAGGGRAPRSLWLSVSACGRALVPPSAKVSGLSWQLPVLCTQAVRFPTLLTSGNCLWISAARFRFPLGSPCTCARSRSFLKLRGSSRVKIQSLPGGGSAGSSWLHGL